MERILRPYDLGSTQWYVLHQLANHGPTPQRQFLSILQIEKPTLSDVVAALVRKGFVAQSTDAADQRQRVLTLTDAGRQRWDNLPDPIASMRGVAFEGVDAETLDLVASVLRAATERLHNHDPERTEK
jgi:DNA-binding MarR family transcriptional regulator